MENTQEEKGLSLVKETHGDITAIFDPNKTKFWSSLTGESLQEQAAILKAMSNPDYKLDDIAEKKILMAKHILAHSVQMITDAGEIVDADRVVMILENGETVAAVSTGFKAGVTNLMNVVGKPPYVPALPLVVTRVKTRRGFNTFNLGIALDMNLPVLGAIETKKGGKQ